MDCIIIDDDATARLIIQQLCLKSKKLHFIAEFSSAIEAVKYLNDNDVDLIFLDIHMPTFSGFDFIQSLKKNPKIVLTTSDKNLALQAFEYKNVIDYLVKPVTESRFHKTLEKIASYTELPKENTKKEKVIDYLYVNVDKRLIKVSISEIYLIEAKGDYINIKTKEKNYLVHSTLKKIQEKLPSNLFFKVHRSYVINLSEIIDIEDNSVLIEKNVIPVSRSHKNELMAKLNLL